MGGALLMCVGQPEIWGNLKVNFRTQRVDRTFSSVLNSTSHRSSTFLYFARRTYSNTLAKSTFRANRVDTTPLAFVPAISAARTADLKIHWALWSCSDLELLGRTINYLAINTDYTHVDLCHESYCYPAVTVSDLNANVDSSRWEGSACEKVQKIGRVIFLIFPHLIALR